MCSAPRGRCICCLNPPLRHPRLDDVGMEGWELTAIEPGVPESSSLADATQQGQIEYVRPTYYFFKRRGGSVGVGGLHIFRLRIPVMSALGQFW